MTLIMRPLLPLALLLLPLATVAQEEGEDDKVKIGPLPETLQPGGSDIQEEMKKLFHQVEQNLQRIDVFLNDASAGDVPLGTVEDSGLDDLLRQTQQDSKQIISDIDRILELAAQQGGQSMSPPQQGSQLDKPRSQGEQDREKTPEKPGGGQPKPEPEQKDGEKGKEGQKPESPEGSDDPGSTKPGDPFDPKRGDPTAVDPDAEEWGMLPTRTREIFRNEGSDDMPVQYRDWIDAYYKRLSKSDR